MGGGEQSSYLFGWLVGWLLFGWLGLVGCLLGQSVSFFVCVKS
jgi:hypothetical protein